ncbi:hypothetical protein J4G37_40585, partial [Microvirga sp. 3-52]|nr:hypothetical protein [Microvirga sp. 3-52]
AVEYLGDYDYYVEKKLEQEELLAEKERAILVNNPPVANKQEDDREKKRQERRLTRSINEIENELSALDDSIADFQEQLSTPDYADDHIKLMEIQNNIDILQAEHDAKAENWLTLQEQLEHL